MDFSNLSGNDLMNIVEFIEKIKGVVPKFKEFLPMLKQWEEAQKLAKDESGEPVLKEGELIIYTANVTTETVYLYVNVVRETPIEGTDESGALIVRELKRFDLFDVLENLASYIPGGL